MKHLTQSLVHSTQSINAIMGNSSTTVAVVIVITMNQIYSLILAQQGQDCP